MNDELEKLNLWFKINKLSLNVKKTNYIIFSKRNFNLTSELCINNMAIEQVKHTTFLGVIIDNTFCWKEQITKVKEKLSRCVGIMYMYRASKIIDSNTLKVLYCSLFLPYLNYCVVAWGRAARCFIDPIRKKY